MKKREKPRIVARSPESVEQVLVLGARAAHESKTRFVHLAIIERARRILDESAPRTGELLDQAETDALNVGLRH